MKIETREKILEVFENILNFENIYKRENNKLKT